MSQQTEQVEDSTESADSVLDSFEDWYHVPVLAAAIAFMLWVRLQSYGKFIRNGEVIFKGNDAWYHLRQVQYTVQNWPATMPFDPWTYFPFGTSVGQFGTLYDQLVATAALVVGLGDPSSTLVAKTLLVAPAVFGALVAIPTYLVGKRLGGRPGGLFGVVVLALFPGTFLRRGLVGFADHNIAEPLFQTFAVLAMMVALTVAERERPVYELLADGDFEALRAPLGFSALAGVATALYLWTWPPGVLLVGIFGVFFGIKLTADYVRGVSPDHLAFVGAVSMTVTGLLLLVPLGTLDMSPTRFSPLQPLLAFAVAGGCVFMAWLAREWDARDLATALYPATIGGIILAVTGVVYLAVPSLFNLIRRNLVRFIGFSAGAQTRTIGEAKPFLSNVQPRFGIEWYDVIMREYGLMLFTAVVAAVWMVWRTYRTDDHRAEQLLVLVWAAFITAAAFTQLRFNYYLAVPVAVLNAYLLKQILSVANLTNRESLTDVEGYQVLAVVFVVLLIVPVLVTPASIGSSGYPAVDNTNTAMQTGQSGPKPGTVNWAGSLDWLANNTPAEGDYANANNEGELDYYGTYQQSNNDFQYPEGSYGVMSWWDYGHWITTRGERIPNANPFQEGADTAAKYLLAPSEQRANNILQTLGNDSEETRYVMVDWKMAEPSSKFSAPTVFHPNVSAGDFYSPVYQQGQNGPQLAFRMKSQRYYQSQVARLYLYHGSRMEPAPVVVDWRAQTYRTPEGETVSYKIGEQGPNATLVRKFQTMQQARQFVANDSTSQIGGIGPFPSESVPALEHYRVVKQSQSSGANSSQYARTLRSEMRLLQQAGMNPRQLLQTSPSWVKTFERVPGATVTGTGPANTTVTAQVQLSPVGQSGSFVYSQQARTGPDGQFTMTLPYSSTGYDNWGPENGYTNVSVRATGPYQFYTSRSIEDGNLTFSNASAEVTEAQVIGESDENVTVELTKESVSLQQNQSGNQTASGNETASGDQTNETASGNESSGNTSALATPSAQSDADAESRSTPESALPDREDTTPMRAGLVGAYAGALVVGLRD
ncbi:oligosaccharyl transferase, archaeosortase A system-associated [Halorussus sp. MSC15.2]|uniref:oligosaccharyl transferase, archaeosortase A system-associated n=1 Tax=Halorussus sp. MSC15.2 TaxID=2283638 RepID=UPI0013D0DD53|nr:oligosaccharyl transferase, archaeosortase A system-associated [Halorussus sp. MSC15.2]NEU57194.1 oligosaccharyl transferase, archaeosortase A system-associated [Halorussus sp. MSC15.2]